MYDVREGRITPDFLPKIKFYKKTTGSIMDLTREKQKFENLQAGSQIRPDIDKYPLKNCHIS